MKPKLMRLGNVARCRSGDKGNHANLGVIALEPQGYDKLRKHLTAEVVAKITERLGVSRVERFEMPNIFALNFVLYDALGGGASRSFRTDTQGKLIGTEAAEWLIPWNGAFDTSAQLPTGKK